MRHSHRFVFLSAPAFDARLLAISHGLYGLGADAGDLSGVFYGFLAARGLAERKDRKSLGVLGDGECDEPEALAVLAWRVVKNSII